MNLTLANDSGSPSLAVRGIQIDDILFSGGAMLVFAGKAHNFYHLVLGSLIRIDPALPVAGRGPASLLLHRALDAGVVAAKSTTCVTFVS